MLTRPMLVLSVVLFALSSYPPTAVADPLVVPSGYLFVNNDPVTGFGIDLGFVGDDFVYVGEAFVETRNFLEGFSPEFFRLQFSPDEVIDPSSNSSCPGCGYAGDLTLIGVPEGGALSRFTMTGTLAGFLPGSPQPVFTHELFGEGTVAASAQSVLYQFEDTAPVPEPATLLLVGGGLAAAVRMRRRRSAGA